MNTLGITNKTTGNGVLELPVSGDLAWQHVARATDTLPATADEALFTITGGRVLLMQIIGEVTTVIQTQTNNTKLKFNPTATGADTDICAVLNISADAVGTLYGITGTIADAMIDGLLQVKAQVAPLILSEGDIELDCAATNTGSVKWDMWYVPMDDGATVAAA
jgi:hypothetical protein